MKIGDKIVIKENGYYSIDDILLRSSSFKPGKTGVISGKGHNNADWLIQLDSDNDNPKFEYYMYNYEFEVIV